MFPLLLLLCVSGCGAPSSEAGAAPGTAAGVQAVAPAAAAPEGRVVILGFDGVDPRIVETLMAEGELPNLARLRDEGTFRPLIPANPPQSPTSWSSFATCTDPGDHGIYDFLRRNPRNYLPGVGFGTTTHAQLGPDGAVTRPARSTNLRKGETFWAAADRQGARCTLIHIPFAYPADDLTDSHMLCGLGVPDIRATQSTFFYFSDAFTPEQLKADVSGGLFVPIEFEGDVAVATFPGAYDSRLTDPAQPGRRGGYVDTSMELEVDRAGRRVTVRAGERSVTVPEKGWSEWMEWEFPVSPRHTVHAISRFFVLEAGDQVRLYMTCLQIDPGDPYVPISEPESYAKELVERYGHYKTIGWAHDTHALRQDALSEDAFLEDVRQTSEWRERLTLDELDKGGFDMLIAVWTGPDRVSHMFWRYRDPKHPLYTEEGARKYGRVVEDTYKNMDDFVGKVAAKLKPNDLLMILSDHGFHSFRTEFNVNTWLVRNGYLALKDQDDPATAYTDVRFLQEFDWDRTRAYSIGLGSIFLNLEGREGRGTVSREEAPALIEELKTKLEQVTDPATGDKVFRAVYTGDIYDGMSKADAPDIQLGYADGYQTGKDSAAGGAPKDVFAPNTDKWSGEHASSDAAATPGILFVNRPIEASDPAIADLGVTALRYLGLDVPESYEGRALLE